MKITDSQRNEQYNHKFSKV